jgi:ankyrin repeat protein
MQLGTKHKPRLSFIQIVQKQFPNLAKLPYEIVEERINGRRPGIRSAHERIESRRAKLAVLTRKEEELAKPKEPTPQEAKDQLLEEIAQYTSGYYTDDIHTDPGFRDWASVRDVVGKRAPSEIQELLQRIKRGGWHIDPLCNDIDRISMDKSQVSPRFPFLKSIFFKTNDGFTSFGFMTYEARGKRRPTGHHHYILISLMMPNETAEKLFDFIKNKDPSIINDVYKKIFPQYHELYKLRLASKVSIIKDGEESIVDNPELSDEEEAEICSKIVTAIRPDPFNIIVEASIEPGEGEFEPLRPLPQKKLDEQLSQSVINGNLANAQSDLEVGANPNLQDVEGESLLMHACTRDDFKMARVLLESKADPNLANNMGYTPLMRAAGRGNLKLVKLLHNHKADLFARDKELDRTAVDFARERNHTKVINFLEKLMEEGKTKIRTKPDEKTTHPIPPQSQEKSKEEKEEPKILTTEEKRELDGHLIDAIKENDLSRVRSLINKREDIDAPLLGGISPLWLAVNAFSPQSYEIAEFLIQRGADVNIREDSIGATPLISASLNGSSKLVELLIKNNANVNEKTYDGLSALHYACEEGHIKTIRLLIENDADVNARSIASRQGALNDPLFQPLLNEKGLSLLSGATPLMSASYRGNEEVVILLLQHQADPTILNDRGESALDFAEKNGHTEVVKHLKKSLDQRKTKIFSKPADKTIHPLPPEIVQKREKDRAEHLSITQMKNKLLDAAVFGRTDEIDSLLEQGAEIEAKRGDGSTSLILAIYHNKEDAARLLIEKGADVNAHDEVNWTPLLDAIDNNMTDLAVLLIQKGADINAKSDDGKMPLSLARERKNEELIMVLEKLGATEPPEPPLEHHIQESLNNKLLAAVNQGMTQLTEELLDQRASIDAKFPDGSSLLEVALEKRYLDLAHLLIDSGADLTDTNELGETLLMISIRQNLPEIARKIIDEDADVNAKNNEGANVLRYAMKCRADEIADYLIKRGAKGPWSKTVLAYRKIKRPAVLLGILAAVGYGAIKKDQISTFIQSQFPEKPAPKVEDKSWLIRVKLENARKAILQRKRKIALHGIRILRELPADESVGLLVELLNDKDPKTRKKAAYVTWRLAKDTDNPGAFNRTIAPLKKIRYSYARRALRMINWGIESQNKKARETK